MLGGPALQNQICQVTTHPRCGTAAARTDDRDPAGALQLHSVLGRLSCDDLEVHVEPGVGGHVMPGQDLH